MRPANFFSLGIVHVSCLSDLNIEPWTVKPKGFIWSFPMKLEAWLNLWPTIWAPTSLWSLEVVAYHIPTYFWLGGGDGWFWSCLADFSLFNFKILFFPGEHLKNRRAPSSNDLLFSGGHDKANQISDSWFHLRTQWSHPRILFLKSPKGSCVGPKDNQPFGAPEKVATWKGEQGSRLISNSWSFLYSICVKNNSLSCILTERT